MHRHSDARASHAVADHVVAQLKERGDPWRLNSEAADNLESLRSVLETEFDSSVTAADSVLQQQRQHDCFSKTNKLHCGA
jgi:hypothetical protein